MELNEIKSIRKLEIEALAVSPFKRKAKKIKYLLRYGMPFNKFIRYALSYAFILPFVKIQTIFKRNAINEKYFEGARGGGENTCYIAVNIGNAGIGDAIVAIRLIKDIADLIDKKDNGTGGIKGGGNTNARPDEKIVADIFYRSPGSIEFITSLQPSIRTVLGLFDYAYLHKFYDINLKLNTYFIKEEINKSSYMKISDKFPALLKITENIKTNQTDLEKYIKTRPFSEGILSDTVTTMGFSRESYLNYAAGVQNHHNNRLKIELDPDIAIKFKLRGSKFITIHDGWDENTKISGKISTKSYPPEKWMELVKLLKLKMPEFLIVQLGGLSNGSNIEGTDANLRGKTTLKEAASILSEAVFHIDTDSGLVHIAASLGTPCVVLFGPTNAAYCSYSENLNIASALCGNCWWSADGWMNACPRGLATPECMGSIEPAEVVNGIKERLNLWIK